MEAEREGGWKEEEGRKSINQTPTLYPDAVWRLLPQFLGRAGCQGRPSLGQGQEQRSFELWLCVRPWGKQPGAPPCASDVSALTLWSPLAQ